MTKSKSFLIKNCKLIPVGQHGEMVLVEFDLYPSALVHIDTFHSSFAINRELYERLNRGETVDVEFEIHYESTYH